MSTSHFFWGSAPPRWREAFPDGQCLEESVALARLRATALATDVLWLSSAQAQWVPILQQVMQPGSRVHVVVVSDSPDPAEGLAALNAGARGYTHAHAVPALLQEVALVVEHGGLWVGPDLLQRLVSSTAAALAQRAAMPHAGESRRAGDNPWAALSASETRVARAVAAGRSNREVGELLSISERTVKAHLTTIFERLGVRDRLQLVLRLSSAAPPAGDSLAEPAP